MASVLLAAPASAHAVLVSSSPADGATVDVEPAAVSLTFDEAVQPVRSADEVISSTTGERVDTGELRQSSDGTTLVMPLRPGLSKGSYTAVWRVVSADTHVVSASVTFGLGVDPAVAPSSTTQRTGPLDVTADVAQGLTYLGMILLLGVVATVAVWWRWALGRRRLRVVVRVGWVATVVGTVGALGLQGPRAVDAGWAGVGRLAGLGQTFGEAYGWELAARLGLLLLVAPVLSRRGPAAVGGRLAPVGVVAALALLATVALAGHESVGPDVLLAFAAAMVHLVAMTVWLGGVTALAVVVLPAYGEHEAVSLPSLRRWSLTAYVCVAALVVSGEYQASRQLDPVQALWSTSYGLVLLVKVGLVAAVLVAAGVAQRRVHAATDDVGPDGVVAAVRRSVRIEVVTAVLVVAATAVLASQPPGNTTYGPAVTLTAPLDADTVRIHVDSTRRGRQVFQLDIVDGAGSAAPVESLTASLSSTSVASLALELRPTTLGTDGRSAVWQSAAVSVPDAGTWEISLDVTMDPTEAYATNTRYRVW